MRTRAFRADELLLSAMASWTGWGVVRTLQIGGAGAKALAEFILARNR